MELLARCPGYNPVFVGDLLDRGGPHDKMIPWIIENQPVSVRGNHDWKLQRWLMGRPVSTDYPGMDKTIACLEEHPEWKQPLLEYLETMPFTIELPYGGVTYNITHACCYPNDAKDPTNKGSQARMMYGKVDSIGPNGFPQRIDLADAWGDAAQFLIHGHVALDEVHIRGKHDNVIGIDTACAYGGKLTGLKLPEFEFESVPLKQEP